MPRKRESKTLFVGIDESNHGRFPEIFVQVTSASPGDFREQTGLPKRRNQKNLGGSLRRRTYTFLEAREDDYQRIPERQFIGTIAASLLNGELERSLERAYILIDGVLRPDQELYTRDLVSDICKIPKGKIEVKSGPKFDTIYSIVNVADRVAHHLHGRKRSARELSKDPKLKYLVA